MTKVAVLAQSVRNVSGTLHWEGEGVTAETLSGRGSVNGIFGVEALGWAPVDIEVDVAFGHPNVVVVGLPDAAVRESRDRVKAALVNTGYRIMSQVNDDSQARTNSPASRGAAR